MYQIASYMMGGQCFKKGADVFRLVHPQHSDEYMHFSLCQTLIRVSRKIQIDFESISLSDSTDHFTKARITTGSTIIRFLM